MCTMRSFPTRIEHVIEWARGQFQKFFTNFPGSCAEFHEDPDSFIDALSQGHNEKVSQSS